MNFFVPPQSIVRKIWSKADTILFIFAGAAAEFALNKAVDWLYFTGRLPADPLGRLFSTVSYARLIVFSEQDAALQAIDKITSIHSAVEAKRNAVIPDWAYRDVLYMLIHYSIASYELLERKLSLNEKDDVYDVFLRMGNRMNLKELPRNYSDWLLDRNAHLINDLSYTALSKDLFNQYKKHLGALRYIILTEGQKLVVPPIVKKQLHFNNYSMAAPLIIIYKFTRIFRMEKLLRSLILPADYKKQIEQLDTPFKPS